MSPGEVIELVGRAKVARCSEALLTLGERPEIYAEARKKLKEFGYSSTVRYLEALCQQILDLGLLPHTNAGLLSKLELRRLRRYNASMGLMLECAAELPAHQQSPGKGPKLRLKTIENAGKLKIPFTTGLIVGVGESFEDRIKSLLALKELHERYGHIQEIIIQPFEPKPNTPMENYSRPSESEILKTVALARSIMPEMNLQVPPNLLGNGGVLKEGSKLEKVVEAIILAGANDFGGISPVSPDFINPDNPWPSVQDLRSTIKKAGFVPRERLPIYPQYVRASHFMSKEVRKRVFELADEDGYRAS